MQARTPPAPCRSIIECASRTKHRNPANAERGGRTQKGSPEWPRWMPVILRHRSPTSAGSRGQVRAHVSDLAPGGLRPGSSSLDGGSVSRIWSTYGRVTPTNAVRIKRRRDASAEADTYRILTWLGGFTPHSQRETCRMTGRCIAQALPLYLAPTLWSGPGTSGALARHRRLPPLSRSGPRSRPRSSSTTSAITASTRCSG